LVRIDARIRDLKVEAVHHDLLRLQRDLSMRAAAIERLVISREAPAAGQCVRALPRFPSVQIAVIFRGSFLLPASEDVILRPDDIVVVLGLQSELEQLTPWFTGGGVANVALLERT
jgi:Trk K+ transport system NAD-binding subunit